MSPRTGRPKVEKPKNHSLKLRYDEEMEKALTAYCEENGILKPEAFRQGIKLLLSQKNLDISGSVYYDDNEALESEAKAMSPRVGRPKVDDPKNAEIKVRFVQSVNEKLLAYCEKHEIPRAEAIRRAVDLLLAQDEK